MIRAQTRKLSELHPWPRSRSLEPPCAGSAGEALIERRDRFRIRRRGGVPDTAVGHPQSCLGAQQSEADGCSRAQLDCQDPELADRALGLPKSSSARRRDERLGECDHARCEWLVGRVDQEGTGALVVGIGLVELLR